MDTEARQLGSSIESVSGAIAEWAVTRHSELDSSLPDRHGANWRTEWIGEARQVLAYLSQALAVGRPEVVAHIVNWSGQAYAARGGDRGDLGVMLNCLRDTIRERLGEAVTQRAVDFLEFAAIELVRELPAPLPSFDVKTADGRLVLRYLECILQGRRLEAEQLVIDIARDGRAVPEIYDAVLQPAMVEIGRMWHQDEISIADEHFATVVTERALARLRDFFGERTPNGRSVITTAVAGELHSVGVNMFSDLLEMDGWRVVALGENMPTLEIIRSVYDQQVDLLAVSLTSFLHLNTVADLIDSIRQQADLVALPVLVGGSPFKLIDDLWLTVGADGCACSASDGVATANRLVG
ncbi:MAG: cobalamin B12-binding domain-containing protein [Planctomycetota bacterium]|jgi:methanogenic corrinoid protein MtbC1